MQHNRLQVSGYLATKPELRYLPSGTKVANVRLGESYRFTGKDQKIQTHTNWHSLTFYDQLADLAVTYGQGDNLFVNWSASGGTVTLDDRAAQVPVESGTDLGVSASTSGVLGHIDADLTSGQQSFHVSGPFACHSPT